jgi:hypothetical protein
VRKEHEQRVKEVADAVRSRSAGKSRAEVRRMFLGELRSRSVKPPSAERASLTVDSIEKILDAMNRDEDLMNAMGRVEPGRAEP